MKIVVAQQNYLVGDIDGNRQQILKLIDAHGADADLLCFSEMCLTGYYPYDLIERPGFFAYQQKNIEIILEASKKYKAAIVLGVICKNEGVGKGFFNSLIVIAKGKIIYQYDKKLLPMYNIFNEARHFQSGEKSGVFEFQNKKIGFLICGDGWFDKEKFAYPSNPVDALADAGVDLIICLNASPSNIDKVQDRLDCFEPIAKRCQSPVIYLNQVGGNDDIVYDGASFVLSETGALLGHLPQFETAVATIDWQEKQLQLQPPFATTPWLNTDALFFHQCYLGLKDYVSKCNFPGIVVAVSGGIDSALTIAMAVQAIGSDKVKAIYMPSRYSSNESTEDANLLCQNLNVTLFTASIESEFALSVARFEKTFGNSPDSITQQNMQARIRGRILMEYSNQTGFLALSTGNKSEFSMGYATLYGDMNGGYNILGDMYKTDVYALANYYNQQFPDMMIPTRILSKAPSAELAPNQKDEDSLPPYAKLDPALKLYIEGTLLSSAEKAECKAAIADLPTSEIEWIHQRVDQAEFKRRQACPILRIQKRSFGMGRQLPIAAEYPQYQMNIHGDENKPVS